MRLYVYSQACAMQHLSCVYCCLQIFWSMFYPGISSIFFLLFTYLTNHVWRT